MKKDILRLFEAYILYENSYDDDTDHFFNIFTKEFDILKDTMKDFIKENEK